MRSYAESEKQKDKELNRWRYPGDPNYLVYDIGFNKFRVMNELSGNCKEFEICTDGTIRPELFNGYSKAFKAYQTEHPAWHNAIPGEVWAVTWNGATTNCIVVRNGISKSGLVFDDGARETPGTRAPSITKAVRILARRASHD